MASPRGDAPSSSSRAAAGLKRTALRYTLSAEEYAVLYHYLSSSSSSSASGNTTSSSRLKAGKAASALKKRLPSVEAYRTVVATDRQTRATAAKSGTDGDDREEVVAATRASLRVFAGTWAGLGLWEGIKTRLLTRGKPPRTRQRIPTLRSPNFRLSLSLSAILLLHRLLYRFFAGLRRNLLLPDARPFRLRNPRVSRVLVSRLAPAVGASLAGFGLGVYPADQLRVTIAIYALSRGAEFAWNAGEMRGWMKWRPWWLGSWLLFPVSCGQLLHAFILDRDCFPKEFGDFILKYSGNYIQQRPDEYPASLPWPDTYEIVENLATTAKMNYPPFISAILFPDSAKTLPAPLTNLAPVVDPAHPAIKHLSCAMLHPSDPSCSRVYITYYIHAFPALARLFAILYTVFALPRYKTFLATPLPALDRLSRGILRTSLFYAGAIGSSWASICLFQHLLPRTFLPTQRFFLGGFLGGLWAFLERRGGRGQFTYAARQSVDSAWKVARKRGWVRAVRNGDVWVFVAGLALLNVVFEGDVSGAAVDSRLFRRALGFARGKGLGDPVKRVEGKTEEEGEGEGQEEAKNTE